MGLQTIVRRKIAVDATLVIAVYVTNGMMIQGNACWPVSQGWLVYLLLRCWGPLRQKSRSLRPRLEPSTLAWETADGVDTSADARTIMWIPLQYSPESNAGEATRPAITSARQLVTCQREHHSASPASLQKMLVAGKTDAKKQSCGSRDTPQDGGTYIIEYRVIARHRYAVP